MSATLEGRARQLLEEPNFCHIATLRRDGRALVLPVWVDVEDGRLVLNSAKGRSWPTNARRNPRVGLLVLNRENPYEYVSIDGRVVETTSEGADQHIDRMAKKYLGQDEYPFRQPGEVRLRILIEPEKVRHRAPG